MSGKADYNGPGTSSNLKWRMSALTPYRVLLFAVVCALAYVAYSIIYPSVNVQYKLTVEVMAAGTVYSSSSVFNATWEQTTYFRVAGAPMHITSRSLCPSVDLGPSGILFIVDALPRLKSSESDIGNGRFLYPDASRLSLLPFVVYPVKPTGAAYVENLLYHEPVSGQLDGTIDVPLDRLPMIVRFRDINNPDSLEELDPKDLSNAYGPGSRVIRVTVEITSDRPRAIPHYWPTWIANDNSPNGLRVAFPPNMKGSATAQTADFISIEQIKGF